MQCSGEDCRQHLNFNYIGPPLAPQVTLGSHARVLKIDGGAENYREE